MPKPPHILSATHWAFPLLVLAAGVLIAVMGDRGRELFQYEFTALESGQSWRWITGHLTHLGWGHFALNGAGLIGVWALYGRQFSSRGWGVIFLSCCLGASLGFYLLDLDLPYYVGLSGVLHGLLAAALTRSLIEMLRSPSRPAAWEDVLIFIGFCAKLIFEQTLGAVPLTEAMSGDSVVVNAHLYGAITGVICGLLMTVFKSYQTLN